VIIDFHTEDVTYLLYLSVYMVLKQVPSYV